MTTPRQLSMKPSTHGAGIALLRLTLGLSLLLPMIRSEAQNTPSSLLSSETERAIVRSQEDLNRARSLMKEAKAKSSRKDFAAAHKDATEALQLAPTGGQQGASARKSIVADYSRISLAYARELISSGLYVEAQTVAKSVLLPSVNPGDKDAVRLLSDLEQPQVFNKTVTPQFAANRERVTALLREAQGLEQSGQRNLAIRRYDEVLRLDPYNTAARKGMEEVNNQNIKYANDAYNETRSRMLWQVEKSWERPLHKPKQGRSTESMGHMLDIRGTDQIVAKLNSIIIQKIDLNDSPISEAVEYLKQKSADQDPSKKGVNIFLKLEAASTSRGEASASTEPHVTLNLSKVPLYVALDYLSKLCNLKLKIDPYAVSIVPLSEPTDVLVTKEYKVPPAFIPQKSTDDGSSQAQAGGSATDPNAPRVSARYNAQEYLASQGVDFPSGASANYLPSGSKLVIRNTRDNIDLIDTLVDAAMGVTPTQVDIQTKFLEINQNNLQELGFSWLLGPFSIGGGVYGSGGGAQGADAPINPFGNPMAGGAPMNQIGALRSGDQAISANSVDSVIAGGTGITSGPAPGIFSIAGVFSDPQFQLVIRALNQKKGIDLMSAPKVTTKSGNKATIKIVSEFIYPRQYDPPQIPQSVSNNGIPPTITPSFPRDFTKQDLGVTLEAKPTIGPDGYTIDLELNPKVTDFDGFINYGTPILAVGYSAVVPVAGLIVSPVSQVLSTNTINQPVFSIREVNTFVTVWDGQTVALGGLIREDVQKVQDKVPILGDVPLAGRLFRSDVDQKFKKNLVIFVTPRIIDAEGQTRRDDTEEPEPVKPLGLPQDLPLPKNSSPAVKTK